MFLPALLTWFTLSHTAVSFEFSAAYAAALLAKKDR
jgi:hypothetical protein